MKTNLTLLFVCLLALVLPAQRRAGLVYAPQDFATLKKGLGQYPVLDRSWDEIQKRADEAIAEGVVVPIPKDPAGAYTHSQHQKNYYSLYAAGLAYALTQDKKYAHHVQALLLAYARMYPRLGKHPQAQGSSPGRLFHQALNDCNWMVYASQAYDLSYPGLSTAARDSIAQFLFRPMCQYLTKDLEKWFSLIHNHGIWASAAVGLTGFALGDSSLVNAALFGLQGDRRSGYFAQLDQLFSPDGYYVEGPYYMRYALLPVFLLAQAIQHQRPNLQVFEYRQQLLKKAVHLLLQLTDEKGQFLPLNDAMKDKTWVTQEMAFCLSILTQQYGVDPRLLPFAHELNKVMLNKGGLELAKYLALSKKLPPFQRQPLLIADGPKGDQGGLAVLRNRGEEPWSAVFKYTTHGMSHGHFDKLNLVLYHGANEVLQDYGSARFLNIEPKNGGRYLPENGSFAQQTIAHNTIVVDENSHFEGKEKNAAPHSGTLFFADLNHPELQIVSAKANQAYSGVSFQRTLALLNAGLKHPLILDIVHLESDSLHQYDLPFYYGGHLMQASFPYQAESALQALGKQNGYQHLWKTAQSTSLPPTAAISWLQGQHFYTLSTATDQPMQVLFARIGANDPRFNLRNDPAVILRKTAQSTTLFSVLEAHGSYNPLAETSSGANTAVQQLQVLLDNPEATLVEIRLPKAHFRLAIANRDARAEATHQVQIGTETIAWQGPYRLWH